MHIPRVFCAPCGEEMRIKTTGALIEAFSNDAESYYKIYADLFYCEACNEEVYLPARAAVAEHWEPTYDQWRTDIKVDLL